MAIYISSPCLNCDAPVWAVIIGFAVLFIVAVALLVAATKD